MSGGVHIPVLLEDVLSYLHADRKGIYLDCTLGLGGHALAILQHNPSAIVYGFDLDEKALLIAKKNLQDFSDRIELYHSDYRYLLDLDLDFSQVRGVLLDLGVSSLQLDSPERGFSFNQEGPLDMRMDLRNNTTAEKIVNKYSEPKLAQVFFEYGELRQSKRLARAIVSKRKINKIETTTQLFTIVEEVCRWRHQKGKTHPAARVFQALRIEVNQELNDLDLYLDKLIRLLPGKSRIVAISFHSLEDRIVKHTFARLASNKETQPLVKIITKKPVLPSEEEVSHNFRSRSAKLRTAEKI